MIKYELRCAQEHGFEAWFRNSADYDKQAERRLVECPVCGSHEVEKAIMAPAIKRSDKGRSPDPERLFEAVAAKARAHIRENFDYVGDKFADEARKIADGDAADRPIWGEAKPEEAKALIEEGAPVAPLPPAFAPIPPRKVN